MDLRTIIFTGLGLIAAAFLDQGLLLWLHRKIDARHRAGGEELRSRPAAISSLRQFLTPSSSEVDAGPRRATAPPRRGSPIASSLGYLRDDVLKDRRRLIRLCLAIVGIGVSAAIGVRYARAVMVQGWQLWAWLGALSLTCFALLPRSFPPLPRRVPWMWLGALFVLGFLLRAVMLEVVPGRLHPDEAGTAHFTQLHVFLPQGITINPFVTGYMAQPAFYSYVLTLAMALAGKSITAIRLSSSIAGALAIPATFAVIAAIDNRRTALLAAAVMTTYHYHIHWSRLALNNVWDTLWVPLVLAAFAWGWKQKWSGGAVLAGLTLGLSQYFYPGSKLAVILLAVLIAQLWQQDPDRRRLGIHVCKLLAAAFCAATPLALFAISNPQLYFTRIPQIVGWTPEAVLEVTGTSTDWLRYFWFQFTHAFGGYLLYQDITGFYGPGIAFTFGASALALVLGVLWAIRLRRWLPLAWLSLTAVLGGFVLLTPPSSSHYVVSIPAVAWLMALPLDALFARGWGKVASVFLATIMIGDLLFYFGVYLPRGAPHLSVPFPIVPAPSGPGG